MSLTQLPAALAAMAQYPQFVLYRLQPSDKPGKMDKLPVDWRTGQLPAKGAGGSEIWTTFENAAAVAPLYGDGCGVGFSFAASDPFWFIDIDGALQADGTWSPLAVELCSRMQGAAIEISQSNRGLHIFGTGVVPDHACKNVALGLELYHEGRFVALTGTGVVGDATLDCSAQLAQVVAQYFPLATPATTPSEWTDAPCPEWRGPADDAELVRRMLASTPANPFGTKAGIRELWGCVVPALAATYPSSTPGEAYDASSADAALATHLAWWTGRDCERIARLMRASGLKREKYDREDYLPRTILRCTAGVDGCYVEGARAADTVELPVAQGVALVEGVAANEPRAIQGSTMASVDDQRKIFAGCVYVRGAHKVLIPGGQLLDAQRFNASAPYNRFSYAMDEGNEKYTRKAFEALTQSQALDWPQANDTCFRPELPPAHITHEGLVNTYWPIDTPCEEGDVTPFLKHMEKMFPVKRDRDILFNYMAALVQFPGDKFQWWPVIQGAKGNGKSAILAVLEHCVGSKYCHRPNASEIAGGGGKFTGWIRDRILVGFEEIRTAHKGEMLEILKPMVTNDRLEIQNKGVDQTTGDNRANGILLTNHTDAIKIDADERRYCALYSAQQTYADIIRDGMDGDYMPDFYHWLKSEGGLAFMNHYLRHMPLVVELNPALNHGGKCHRGPDTSSTVVAKSATMGKVEQEILEAIAEGRSGFCGGWVSSIELDKMLADKRMESLVPRNKRPTMMRELGYIHHPGLVNGRATAPNSQGQRPVFYIREGHIAGNITGGAAITRAYEAAQLQRVFGLDKESATG